jgi:hypothetical protein
MGEIQPITHDGRLAAIVVGEQAIIPDTLADSQLLPVSARCLYALEIAAGHLPGPYTDRAAEAYARAAAAQSN